MRLLDQAAQMRVPLCLLLLVAHVVDTLPLNRRKKQGKRSSPTGVGAQRSSEEGQTGHGWCWAMDPQDNCHLVLQTVPKTLALQAGTRRLCKEGWSSSIPPHRTPQIFQALQCPAQSRLKAQGPE